MWWSKKNCFHISWKSIQLPEFVCDTPCCRCFHSLVWEPCLWLLACCFPFPFAFPAFPFPFPFALLFHLPSLWLSPCISRVACFWIATAIALHLCLAFCLGFGPAFACWFQWQLLVVGITLKLWNLTSRESSLFQSAPEHLRGILKGKGLVLLKEMLDESLFSQVGAQGHFVVYNASKNVVAFLAHLIFPNCTRVIPTPISSVFSMAMFQSSGVKFWSTYLLIVDEGKGFDMWTLEGMLAENPPSAAITSLIAVTFTV